MACSGCPGRHRVKISNILKVALLSAQRLLGKVFLTCRKFWSEFSRNLEIQTLNVPSITGWTIIRRCVGLIWDLASKSKLKHLLPSQESFYLKKSWFGLKPEKEDLKLNHVQCYVIVIKCVFSKPNLVQTIFRQCDSSNLQLERPDKPTD